MKLTKQTALEIANDFISRFNPNLWDGAGDLDPDLNLTYYGSYNVFLPNGDLLYIRFEEIPETNIYYHRVSVYNPNHGKTDICSGKSLTNPDDIAESIILLFDDLEVEKDGWERDICVDVRFVCTFAEPWTKTYDSKDAAEKEIKEGMSDIIRNYFSDSKYKVSDNGKEIDIWQPGGNLYASWERMWI